MTKLGMTASVSAMVLLLEGAGCVAALDQAKAGEAQKALPETFTSSQSAVAAQATEANNLAQQHWEDFFADPNLRSLIDLALRNNQELNTRLQEIIIARNEVAAKRGEIFPKIDAGGGVGLEKVGLDTSQGAADEANGLPVNLPAFGFGLVASWEVDIWGKLRNAAKAANHRYMSTVEAKNFLITEIVAEIANSYYELLALDNQLEVLEKNIKIQEDALEVVKLKKKAGRATELAVQKFQAEILKNKGLRYSLEQQRVETENRINFLVGRFPEKVERQADTFMATAAVSIDTGLPSQLLQNRPDVREAELLLEAAKLDVDVARARFYPSVSIDLELGYSAFNPAHLIATPASLAYNLAGSVMMPLVNRAGIVADYRSANAQQIQAVINFERTLLKAFTEVTNQLTKTENMRQRYQMQSDQVRTLQEAITVSNLLYNSARADYMEVLMTRRDSLEAEMELIETKKQQMQALVGVYQALGGGWRPRE